MGVRRWICITEPRSAIHATRRNLGRDPSFGACRCRAQRTAGAVRRGTPAPPRISAPAAGSRARGRRSARTPQNRAASLNTANVTLAISGSGSVMADRATKLSRPPSTPTRAVRVGADRWPAPRPCGELSPASCHPRLARSLVRGTRRRRFSRPTSSRSYAPAAPGCAIASARHGRRRLACRQLGSRLVQRSSWTGMGAS
jgi:hypothetical protein